MRRQLIESISWMAVPLLAGVASAQSCAPFWTTVGDASVSLYDVLTTSVGGITFLTRNTPSVGVFRWDANHWTPLPLSGLPALTDYPDLRELDDGTGRALYFFMSPNTTNPCNSGWSARWSGSSWQLMPESFYPCGNPSVTPAISTDLGDGPHAYGWGPFSPGARFCRWEGQSWSTIGIVSGVGGFIRKVLAFNDGSGPALWVFGEFNAVNGVPATQMAKWDGQRWTGPSPNILATNVVGDACVYDDGTGPAIYSVWPPQMNGTFSSGLYKFDGHNWSRVGATVPQTTFTPGALDVFDDGRGPALYVTGSFQNFNGVPARGIVRYDGHSFEALGNGMTPGVRVLRLTPFPDPRGPAMLVIGLPSAASVGAGTVTGGALWVGCPNCYNNCDTSSATPKLNVNDFVCFLNAYARRDPYANCNVDAVINVADFICFMNKFAVGCP